MQRLGPGPWRVTSAAAVLPKDRRAPEKAESRRWAEVRDAVREAKELDLYAIEVRGESWREGHSQEFPFQGARGGAFMSAEGSIFSRVVRGAL